MKPLDTSWGNGDVLSGVFEAPMKALGHFVKIASIDHTLLRFDFYAMHLLHEPFATWTRNTFRLLIWVGRKTGFPYMVKNQIAPLPLELGF